MNGLLFIANMAPDLVTVINWMDFGTLGLLFGMMVIVGQLKKTGVFEVRGVRGGPVCSASGSACLSVFVSAVCYVFEMRV